MVELLLILAMGTSGPPCDKDDSGFFGCIEEGGGGVDTGLNLIQVQGLAESYPPGSSADNPTSWYEYVAVIACHQNSPAQPKLEICQQAIDYCQQNAPESPGPYAIIHRRLADESGPLSGWQSVAPTCFTPSVPARSGEPAVELTEAMIVEQFHRTDFALPEAVIQPPDGKTLVNLPVYFELAWPATGFEPQEVDTTTIVGHQVRIRPTLVGITYITGDGATIGPTTSMGGPYPDGDITHEYTTRAQVSPSISVEYGGEVSVDGGGWRAIPSSATIEGPPVPLEVLTSKNRLYDN